MCLSEIDYSFIHSEPFLTVVDGTTFVCGGADDDESYGNMCTTYDVASSKMNILFSKNEM